MTDRLPPTTEIQAGNEMQELQQANSLLEELINKRFISSPDDNEKE